MPCINLDIDYFDHVKTIRLVGLLGKGSELLPIKLWCRAAKHHGEDGRMKGYTAQEIESVVGWWGKSGQMVEAMVKLGFLEQLGPDDFRVHAWEERQGHIAAFQERGRVAARARWDRIRNASSNASSMQQALPLPNLAVPNEQLPSHAPPPPKASKRPKQPPDPRIRVLVDAFYERLQTKLGERPAKFNGAAAASGAKRLLVSYSPEQITERMDVWFKSDDPHVTKRGHRVEDFLSYFNLLKDGPVRKNAAYYLNGAKSPTQPEPDPAKPYLIDTPIRKLICAYKELLGVKRDDRIWDQGGNWERAEQYAKPMLDAFKGNWKGALDFMESQAKELRAKNLTFTMRTLWERAIPWLREQERKNLLEASQWKN